MVKDSKKDGFDGKNNVLSRFIDFTGSISNEYRTFLVKKCERLASALYVITGFIDPQDPVRIKLRSSAIDLISQSSHPNQNLPDVFGARCAEIVALIETAKSGGLISQMNAMLICDEYASLATFFSDHKSRITDQQKYTDNGALVSSKGHLVSMSVKSHVVKNISNDLYKRQNERKSFILKIISKKDNVSIKDITSEIHGYSEKTIQRDLIALVRDGTLKREGERRWSTYRKIVPAEKKSELPPPDNLNSLPHQQ